MLLKLDVLIVMGFCVLDACWVWVLACLFCMLHFGLVAEVACGCFVVGWLCCY